MTKSRVFFLSGSILVIIFGLHYLTSEGSTPLHAQTAAGGGPISLQTAINLTTSYRASVSASAVKAVYFSSSVLQSVTNQAGAVGARFYYGRKPDGTLVLVIVGVDANGQDILTGTIIDDGFPCPPFCDTSGGLK